MSFVFDEEFQRFTFGTTWEVFRYDCEESGYKAISDLVPGTRSCDLVGLRADGVHLIEIKDFRGYRILNKRRLSDGELAVEVAQKVRDTLSGIVSGIRRDDRNRPWLKILSHLSSPDHRLVCVQLWIEDDLAADHLKWKQRLSVLTQQLKQKLHWLRVRVIVCSPNTLGGVADLGVTNLPGACGH